MSEKMKFKSNLITKPVGLLGLCKSDLYDILQKITHETTSFIQLTPPPEIVDKLNITPSCKGGQGRANGCTTQEASFAYLLENKSFEYIPKNVRPSVDGIYYVYQPHGSQRSPDFTLFYYESGETLWSVDIDMKQSKTDNIVLNDGWFNQDTIYILSYRAEKQDKVVVGLGQDIPSLQEKDMWEQILKKKKELNSGVKIVGNLNICFRCANRYNCKHFNKETTEQYIRSVKKFLESTSEKLKII